MYIWHAYFVKSHNNHNDTLQFQFRLQIWLSESWVQVYFSLSLSRSALFYLIRLRNAEILDKQMENKSKESDYVHIYTYTYVSKKVKQREWKREREG